VLAALLGLILTPPPGLSDFFPLVPGTIYTFLDSRAVQPVTWTVKPSEKLDNGVQAVPVDVGSENSVRHTTVYYVVKEDGVYTVDPKDTAPEPFMTPLFLWAKGDGEWDFSGETSDRRTVKITGGTHPSGHESVLGKDTEVEEINLDTKDPLSTSPQVHKTMVLAKGVGVVMMDESWPAGSRMPHVLKLLEVKAAKGN
jgi:hypothetical protein